MWRANILLAILVRCLKLCSGVQILEMRPACNRPQDGVMVWSDLKVPGRNEHISLALGKKVQSLRRVRLCDPVDCGTPGFPVHLQLPERAQTPFRVRKDPAKEDLGFLGGTSDKGPVCQSRRHQRPRFDPWVGKVPWKSAWQPTPVFLLAGSHGQRSLVGSSPQGSEDSDMTGVTQHTHKGRLEGKVMFGQELKDKKKLTWRGADRETSRVNGTEVWTWMV